MTIADNALDTLTPGAVRVLHNLRNLVAENARTARRFIKLTDPPYRIDELVISEIDKHGPNNIPSMLKPLMSGSDMGLLSEAGCPGIADPGAEFVSFAHQHSIAVKPLVGPSSILLALMASGLNGQGFSFQGYLPRDKRQLAGALKTLEAESRRRNMTQICIEAPYRNNSFLESCLTTLQPSTLLSIAAGITGPDEFIKTASVSDWNRTTKPNFHKIPAVFSFLAQ